MNKGSSGISRRWPRRCSSSNYICVVNHDLLGSICDNTKEERMFVGQVFLGLLWCRIWELRVFGNIHN